MREPGFVIQLDTPDALEHFWLSSQGKYLYAARGMDLCGRNTLLLPNQWVFGESREAVIDKVFRWSEAGIQCEWVQETHDDGYWHIPTLPEGWEMLNHLTDPYDGLDNPALTPQEATRLYQANIFDCMEFDTSCDVWAYRKGSMKRTIKEWRQLHKVATEGDLAC